MTPSGTAPILLIEHATAQRLAHESALRKAGHLVLGTPTLADGRAALDHCGARIVLLDLSLPDGDGLDLLAELVGQRPDVAVVVIATDRSVDRAAAAMQAGARGYLVRPFDSTRLLHVVDAAFAGLNDVRVGAALRGVVDQNAPASAAVPPAPDGLTEALAGQTLAQIERAVIEAAVARNGGSVPRAARELAVSPSTLYRKIDGWTDES